MARVRRRGALLLAPAVVAAALLLQLWRFPTFFRYAPPDLPGFDAYVYVAAAEEPRVFTVAPWGHRVLVPWLAAALPGSLTATFPAITLASVAAAALLVHALLRRRGHGRTVSLLGAAAVVLSPPLGEMIGSPFLVDATAAAALAALLLALECAAPLPVLAAVAVSGALAREVFVLFLPVVFFARGGPARARVRDAGVVMAAAGAALLALRLFWTPGVYTPLPRMDADRATLLAASLGGRPDLWLRTLAMGGLFPLAALGAFRPAGRDVLRRYGFVLGAALLQPALAHYAIQQVVGEFNRYLVYAVPVVVLLAAAALEPRPGPPAERVAFPRWVSAAAVALVAVLVAGPALLVDPYRRLDLQGRRDGLHVLAFCRETLHAARRLATGRPVLLRTRERRFRPGVFDTAVFERMRWYLREGWGPNPHYGTDEVVMEGDQAEVVVPVLEPALLEVTLALGAAAPTTVFVSFNGRSLGEAEVGRDRERWRFLVPAGSQFRGDNVLELRVAASAPRARLYAVALSPLPPLTPR